MAGPFDAHRERRALFGDNAAAYRDGRPGYPDRVYDLLAERGGLGPGTRVIEIGPGAGQATVALLDAGATVTAIELSADLAATLREVCGARALTIEVGAFEDVVLPPESADLVVSATAFHWVPPGPGVAACADVLRDDGALALWWTVYGDDDRPDPFSDALVPILERLAPELLDVPGAGSPALGVVPHALDTHARIAEIEAGGRFEVTHHETIPWTGRHSSAELRALFSSFSPWLAVADDERALVLDALERLAVEEFGGVVERPYLTRIYLARKRPRR